MEYWVSGDISENVLEKLQKESLEEFFMNFCRHFQVNFGRNIWWNLQLNSCRNIWRISWKNPWRNICIQRKYLKKWKEVFFWKISEKESREEYIKQNKWKPSVNISRKIFGEISGEIAVNNPGDFSGKIWNAFLRKKNRGELPSSFLRKLC